MDPDRLMRNMMQGMGMPMPMPFGGMFGGEFNQFPPNPQIHHHMDPISAMMPHGFMSPMSMMMMNPFQHMQQAMSLANNGTPSGFSYCSSSVTSYTTDEHGRPQVYQQSREVKSGPGGLKETKSAIRDSRTGHQELAIGHHLKDKAHIKKKSKNVYTGEEEQAEDFVNIEETEAESFEQTWRNHAKNATPTSHGQLQYGKPSRNSHRLALTSSAHEDKPMKAKKKKKCKETK